VRLPGVVAHDQVSITMTRVDTGTPSQKGAEELGRSLAQLHDAGAPAFGASWPGFIGPLPMDNSPTPDWPSFFATRRVLPFLRAGVDRGRVPTGAARAVERTIAQIDEVAGPSGAEPPSRIHGDLWSGNVLWDRNGRPWLIDPAAHGGHRETDLAMLALFGAPHLERVLSAYREVRPLTEGWRRRVALHQLHPLLVHAVLFGGGYGDRAGVLASELVA